MFQVEIGEQRYGVHFEHYPPTLGVAGATFCFIDLLIDEKSKKLLTYGSCALTKECWGKMSRNERRKEALKQALDLGDFDSARRKLFWDAYHEKRGYKGRANVVLPMTDETLTRLNAVADWGGHTKKTVLKQMVNDAYDGINGNGESQELVSNLLGAVSQIFS